MQIFNPEKWYKYQKPFKIDTKLKFSVEKFNQRRNNRIKSEKNFFLRIWYFLTNPVTYILFGFKRY